MTDSSMKMLNADASVEGKDVLGTLESAERLCDNREYPDMNYHQEDGLCWQKTDRKNSISAQP